MRFLSVCAILLFTVCILSCKEGNKNEDQANWIPLFNGKDLNDWVVKINGQQLNTDIYNTFRVENGVMKVSYDEYDVFDDEYGHIFYKDPFSSYRLKLQYRFVGEQVNGGQRWAAKNSGVMVHSQSPESMGLDQGFPVSLEIQFLGGLEPDEPRPTGNLCTPGMHVIMNDELVTEHCIESSSGTYYDDQWIDIEVLVIKDSIIRHKVNGKEVISYSKPVIGGEYNVFDDRVGEAVTSGYISLQSESHPIEFRNISLLKLDD